MIRPSEGKLLQPACFEIPVDTQADVKRTLTYIPLPCPALGALRQLPIPPRPRHTEGALLVLSSLKDLRPIQSMHRIAAVATCQSSTAARMYTHVPCSPLTRAATAAASRKRFKKAALHDFGLAISFKENCDHAAIVERSQMMRLADPRSTIKRSPRSAKRRD